MLRISQLLISTLLVGIVLGKHFHSVDPLWKNRGQIVFLGDSITDFWDSDGKETWEEFYVPLGAVNTGVSGDRTSTIIDRINNQGIIDNLNSYVAILKIGTNDLAGGVDETTVVQNIGIIIDLIKAKNPGVKILLLGILPRSGAAIHKQIRNVNALIANYFDDQTVFFMNMETQFSNALGEVDPELFTDGLHLSAQGYRVWAQTMNPLLDTTLAKPFSAKAVWLGDSLTAQWKTKGLPIWTSYYESIESLNVAVSGHTSSQTINRIEKDGVLDGINSKVAILMIGGNDLRAGATASPVIENIKRIIELIQMKLPHGRILLLGLLPAGGMPDSLIQQGNLINAALSTMENGDDIRYLEMKSQFSDSSGDIYQYLYDADKFHLSEQGYVIWQKTMNSLFHELLQF